MSGHDARLLARPTPLAHPTPLPSRIPGRASPGTAGLLDVHLVIRFLVQPFHLLFHEPSVTPSYSCPGPSIVRTLLLASLTLLRSSRTRLAFPFCPVQEEKFAFKVTGLHPESNGKFDDCLNATVFSESKAGLPSISKSFSHAK